MMDPTTAIVLRTIEFSETSLIVVLLTRDFGRLSAMAKGARRPKGPFEGSLDLLSVCRVVVLRKRSDTLDLLTEAKLQRRFRGADRSMERLYGGYYVAEMLRLLMDDHPCCTLTCKRCGCSGMRRDWIVAPAAAVPYRPRQGFRSRCWPGASSARAAADASGKPLRCVRW